MLQQPPDVGFDAEKSVIETVSKPAGGFVPGSPDRGLRWLASGLETVRKTTHDRAIGKIH